LARPRRSLVRSARSSGIRSPPALASPRRSSLSGRTHASALSHVRSIVTCLLVSPLACSSLSTCTCQLCPPRCTPARSAHVHNHYHHYSVNTSTTNAPIENQRRGGDSLRYYLSSTSDIQKINRFCVAGSVSRQGSQANTHHGWFWFFGFLVFGCWFFGFRFSVFGFWFLVFGFWFLVFGFWFRVFTFRDQNSITCYIGRYRPP
jgi:hypothetical protein